MKVVAHLRRLPGPGVAERLRCDSPSGNLGATVVHALDA